MTPLLLALATLSPLSDVETLFVKVGPDPKVPGRSPNQARAVVLIHGLCLHVLHKDRIPRAQPRFWQQADSPLVRRLGRDADVYALAYAQTAPVEQIAQAPLLLQHLRRLRDAGYRHIVLVGHSAGGLIARQLVEDHPGLGVTRVIQVCAPNAGSAWAVLKTAHPAQMPFLNSLTRAARLKALEGRAEKRVPESVAFVCLVAATRVGGDGVVPNRSQWSPDLQSQGVPAYPLRATHWDAMRNPQTADLLARLIVEPQPRWDAQKVAQARKHLLGG